jgi:hypothetical protein
MRHVRARLQVIGALAVVTALVWGGGMLASALPQSERLHAAVHSVRSADYATDVVAPGSRFTQSRPAYDQ